MMKITDRNREIARRMKEERLRCGFTQAQVAKAVGVTINKYRSYEQGRCWFIFLKLVLGLIEIGMNFLDILGEWNSEGDLLYLANSLTNSRELLYRLDYIPRKMVDELEVLTNEMDYVLEDSVMVEETVAILKEKIPLLIKQLEQIWAVSGNCKAETKDADICEELWGKEYAKDLTLKPFYFYLFVQTYRSFNKYEYEIEKRAVKNS